MKRIITLVFLSISICSVTFGQNKEVENSDYTVLLRNRIAGKFQYYMNNSLYHLLPTLFSSQTEYENFYGKLQDYVLSKKRIDLKPRNNTFLKTISSNSLSFEMANGSADDAITLNFSANPFNNLLIESVNWNPSTGGESAKTDATNSIDLYKLSTRKDVLQTASTYPILYTSNVSNIGGGVLELNRNISNTSVQSTQGVNSIAFPAITYNYTNWLGQPASASYNVGRVISNSDIAQTIRDSYFGKSPIRDIYDGTTYITYATVWGTDYPYGCAVILERNYKRLALYNNGKEIDYYGNNTGDYRFSDPVAVKVISNFLYVLDAGKKKVIIFQISSVNNVTSITYIAESNFGLNLISPRDIGGVEIGSGVKLMFIADGNTIKKLYLKTDGITLEPAFGAPITITGVTNPNNINDFTPFNGIKRLDVSGYVGSTSYLTGFCMVLTDNNEAITFAANVVPNPPFSTLRPPYCFKTTFTDGFTLNNLGYHLNNDSWYVSDNTGRLHTFSEEGFYIGTNCQQGTNENSTDLLHPGSISQNYSQFRNEFVVGDEWGLNTGLKLFVPQVKLTNLFVIEKNTSGGLTGDKLDFHFSLTQKPTVNFSIVLKVNGTQVSSAGYNYTTTDPFSASYGYEVLNASMPSLVCGWNTLNVTVTGTGLNETSSIDFFWLPDEISTGYSATTTTNNLLQPVYVYKNIKVNSGNNWLSLKCAKTVILPNCTLRVEPWNTLELSNGTFYFGANSNILIKNNNESRTINNCVFDGVGIATNLVQVDWNSYGLGSAYSDLGIANCIFRNYAGTALALNYVPKAILGRTQFVMPPINLDLNSQIQIKGLSLNNVAAADLYECTFTNNHIGLDAISVADLKVNYTTATSVNIGTSSILFPLANKFTGNKIGLNAYLTTLKSTDAIYQSNGTAIQSIGGVVNCASPVIQSVNNVNNRFISNNKGIMFSGNLIMQNGINSFIGNIIEVSYITGYYNGKSGPVLIPASFQWECNYWVHGSGSGAFIPPVFEVIYPANTAPNPALYIFDYSPFLTTSNGTTYTCNGNVGNPTGKLMSANSGGAEPPTEIHTPSGQTTTQLFALAETNMDAGDFKTAKQQLRDARIAFENYSQPTNIESKIENKTIAKRELDAAEIIKQYGMSENGKLTSGGDTTNEFLSLQHFYNHRLDDSANVSIDQDEWFIQNSEALVGSGNLDSAVSYLLNTVSKNNIDISLGTYDVQRALIDQAYYKYCAISLLAAIDAYADSASVKKTIAPHSGVISKNKREVLVNALGINAGLAKLSVASTSSTMTLQDLISSDQIRLNFLLNGETQSSLYQDDEVVLPKENGMMCFPNPFSDRATIKLNIAESGKYNLNMYNIMGERVQTLMNFKALDAGVYEYNVQVSGLSTGLYFIDFTNEHNTRIKVIKVEFINPDKK